MPKGVDVAHGNVTNTLCLAPANLQIGPGSRVCQVLNVSFDMAAWEILGCLMNGGTLVLRTSDWAACLREVSPDCTQYIFSFAKPHQGRHFHWHSIHPG